ncbi:LuxR C-terminal-related transcriptional regulator [Actinoplanes sp. CA-015351]|uniref:helix-turn-helix transcriptional regulator n=1 Tax=Actinoplanes sp. CA-015351 TaxID=3239897 RepID=UPI003D9876E8
MQKLPPSVARLLAGAEAGHRGALVVQGLPGAGRTTLARAAAASAHDWTVLSASGHGDESDIAFAGLQRLLTGDLGRALSAASPQVERLALGLSLQTSLGTLTAQRPLLVVIDDAHLMDEPSWHAVLFVARRLTRFALLATMPAGADPDGLPVFPLDPLPRDTARDLLARHAPDLAREVADAVIDLAGGNPAALIELAGALSPEQRRGYAPLPRTLPPASPLLRRHRAILESLPAVTRDLLLLAAARPAVPLPDLLAAPFSPAPASLDDLAPAERAGLIVIDGTAVRFGSPLARDCAYSGDVVSRRRAAHLALARVLEAGGDRLAALLHRAAAATGPDPALARDLTWAARTAEPEAAAEARRWAAELYRDPGDRGEALLDAARFAWLTGRPHDAGLMIRRIPRAAGPARVRARGLTAEMGLPDGRPGARDLLLDVATELADSDTPTALEALALAGEAAARPGEQGRYAGVARRVTARQRGDEPPAVTLSFHHVAGLARMADGDEPAAFARFRRALDAADRVTDPGTLVRAATAGILVGDVRRAAAVAGRAAVLARESGATVLVPQALEMAATAELASGAYASAHTAALDGAAMARATGQPALAAVHSAVLAVLAALVGDRETALTRIAAAGGGPSRALCDWALALLDLVGGRAPAAAERLGRVVTASPGYGSALLQVAVVPHLLEAGAGSPGSAAQAGAGSLGLDAVAAGFDRWAGRTGQPVWLALRDRCRALRADDAEAAETHFREALRHTGEAGFPRAHTELLYGKLLRRRRRHVEARTHLRRAAETFRMLDAEPWAAQSVRELRAAGERVESRKMSLDGLELTAQQERIAALVAGGATNREVAQELHLSPRTVDHHLRNVFARLGVRSRTEMARKLL